MMFNIAWKRSPGRSEESSQSWSNNRRNRQNSTRRDSRYVKPICFSLRPHALFYHFVMTAERNAYPSPLNYYNYPKSCCISVNEIICHGMGVLTMICCFQVWIVLWCFSWWNNRHSGPIRSSGWRHRQLRHFSISRWVPLWLKRNILRRERRWGG